MGGYLYAAIPALSPENLKSSIVMRLISSRQAIYLVRNVECDSFCGAAGPTPRWGAEAAP